MIVRNVSRDASMADRPVEKIDLGFGGATLLRSMFAVLVFCGGLRIEGLEI